MSDDKRRDEYEMELGEKNPKTFERQPSPLRYTPPAAPSSGLANHPALPVVSYCASSILMTVTNKYVLSNDGFNLNFFLLTVQVKYPKSSIALRIYADPLQVSRLCRGYSELQISRRHNISRLQQG